MARKAARKPEPHQSAPAVVTFPLHVTRDVWDRFKDALDRDESAHGVLIQFIEDVAHGTRKPNRK